MTKIDVSIILVNYKASHLLKDVLSSIKEKSSSFTYEVIVVDNSCDQEEWDKLQEFKDTATLIDAKANLGFGKANNLGAEIAKGKYLYFLNTDTLLINNAIYELKKFLDEHENVSIVGSNLYTRDGKPNHSYIPFEVDLKGEKRINSLLSSFKNKVLHKRFDFNYKDEPLKIDGYVCGASLMIRREDFIALGGFDKDIFMYAEETLLCYRLIHELHKEIYNVPSSKIIHFEGESFEKKISYFRAKANIDGCTIYLTKAYGRDAAIAYLRSYRASCKRKRVLARVIRKKDKVESFTYLIQAATEKLQELKSKR